MTNPGDDDYAKLKLELLRERERHTETLESLASALKNLQEALESNEQLQQKVQELQQQVADSNSHNAQQWRTYKQSLNHVKAQRSKAEEHLVLLRRQSNELSASLSAPSATSSTSMGERSVSTSAVHSQQSMQLPSPPTTPDNDLSQPDPGQAFHLLASSIPSGTNRLETGEFVVEAPSGGISHTNSSGSLPLSASGNTPANNLITTTSTTSSTTTNSTGIPAAAGGSADMRVILFTRPFSKVPNVIVLRYDPAVPVSARTYKRKILKLVATFENGFAIETHKVGGYYWIAFESLPNHVLSVGNIISTIMEDAKVGLQTEVDLRRWSERHPINATDNHLNCLLHASAYRGLYSYVAHLIKKGADVNLQDKKGWAALHFALSPGYLDIALLLLQNGANANLLSLDGSSALHYFMNFPVKPAQHALCAKVLNLLIEKKVNPDCQNQYGETCLHYAALKNNEYAMSLLLKTGLANPNIKNKNGETCLHYAVRAQNQEIIQLLLEHNADPSIRGKHGSCIEVAVSTDNNDIIAMFKPELVPAVVLFPEELIAEIFSYLTPQQLRNVTLVCTLFHRLCLHVILSKMYWRKLGKQRSAYLEEIRNMKLFENMNAQIQNYVSNLNQWRDLQYVGPGLARHADYNFKISIVGNCGVGKSCLFHRFLYGTWRADSAMTIEHQLRDCMVMVDHKLVKLRILDSADQRYRFINQSLIYRSDAYIICYDVTDKTSWDNVTEWIKEIDRYAYVGGHMKVVVATKMDAVQKTSRPVPYKTVLSFTKETGLVVMDTSSKDNVHVELPFKVLVNKLFEKANSSKPATSDPDALIIKPELSLAARKQLDRNCILS